MFCDNDIENVAEMFRGLFASGDLGIAFAVVEAYPVIEFDVSLDLAMDNLAQWNLSTTHEVAEAAKVINRLRKSKEVEYLIPDEVLDYLKRMIQTFAGNKHKYDEILQPQMFPDIRHDSRMIPPCFGQCCGKSSTQALTQPTSSMHHPERRGCWVAVLELKLHSRAHVDTTSTQENATR